MKPYGLIYTKRKRTISITVTPKLEVIVKAPKHVSKKEIDEFVIKKSKWIENKLDVFKRNKYNFIKKEYDPNQAVEYITKKAKGVFELFKNEVSSPPEIKFRKTKTRWGACSNKGTITFNPDLINTGTKCIEYVITHEFCHLLEHNHSKKFYALLENKMPDWRVWRKKLRDTILV